MSRCPSIRILVRYGCLVALFLPTLLPAQEELGYTERVRRSTHVVVAEVQELQSEIVDVNPQRILKSYRVRCTVHRVLKGTLGGEELTFSFRRRIGRTTGRREVTVREGIVYAFFLDRLPDGGAGLRLFSPFDGAARVFGGTLDAVTAAVESSVGQGLAPGGVSVPRIPSSPPVAPEREGPSSPGLELKLVTPFPRYGLDDPVPWAWMILSNRTGSRFPVEAAAWPTRVFFEVVRLTSGGDGEPLEPRKVDPSISRTEPGDVLTLGPEEYLVAPVDLAVRYGTLSPGRYRLQAVFETGQIALPGSAAGTVPIDPIRSNLLTIEIVDRAGVRQTGVLRRFVRSGTCQGGHEEVLEPGTCVLCQGATRSTQRKLCVPCSMELGVCGLCGRRAKR